MSAKALARTLAMTCAVTKAAAIVIATAGTHTIAEIYGATASGSALG